MYGATAPVEHDGKTWFLQLAVSERLMDLFHGAFALPFMGAGIVLFSLVMLFVFAACAYITVGYTLKPLREVSESAAAISPRSLHSRLQVSSIPSEVVPLVDSFNRALQRLENVAEAVDVRLVLAQAPIAADPWQADRSALFTLLKNLLENAIQHALKALRCEWKLARTT